MELDIQVRGETIECSTDKSLLWTMRLDSIVLVAEYTTDWGPWADDWFLVLWEMEDSKLVTAKVPVGAKTGKLVNAKLAALRNEIAHLELVNSTDWRSRVVWPSSLRGAKYFKLTPIYEAGVIGWLKRKMLKPSLDLNLTEEVRAYLESIRYQRGAESVDIG